MLLFLANFVSILIVGLAIFWAGGLAPKQPRSLRNIVGHFGPAVVAFAAVTVILTNSLFRIIKDRQTEYGIRSTLQEQLALAPSADLQDVVYRATPQGIQIMAVVRSQRTISPSWVSSIEEAIEETIDSEVDLVVRTLRSRDVSRVGKSLRAVRPNLNGTFLVEANEGFAAREAIATQVIREMFETEPAFELTRVEYGISPDDEGIIVAYINAIRRLGQIEVRELQQRLRGRLQDDSLRLFVTCRRSQPAGPERACTGRVGQQAHRGASEYRRNVRDRAGNSACREADNGPGAVGRPFQLAGRTLARAGRGRRSW